MNEVNRNENCVSKYEKSYENFIVCQGLGNSDKGTYSSCNYTYVHLSKIGGYGFGHIPVAPL